MSNGGSERPASLRQQDTDTFSDKIPSTKQRFSSPASACSSFRIYYYYDGAAGSIPFEWESHPGTPKHPSSELPPPLPLTPPPSHFSFSGDQIRRYSKNPIKKILELIPTKLFWLSSGGHKKKVKKLSASSQSLSERVLIDENEYHLVKFQTKGKVIKRFSSFDSSIDHHPTIRRSQSTSCFGIRRCLIWEINGDFPAENHGSCASLGPCHHPCSICLRRNPHLCFFVIGSTSTSWEWIKSLQFYSSIFQDLSPVCSNLSLREIGVKNSIGISFHLHSISSSPVV